MLEFAPKKLVPNWMEVCGLNDWQKARTLGEYEGFHDIHTDNFNMIADYLVGEVGVLPEDLEGWFFRRALTDGGVEMLPVDILQEENGFERVLEMAEKQLKIRLERADVPPSPEEAQQETVMWLGPRRLQSVARVTGTFEKIFSDNGLRYPHNTTTRATLLETDTDSPTVLRMTKVGPITEYRTTTMSNNYEDILSITFVEGALAKTILFTSMVPSIEIPRHEIVEPSDFSAPPNVSDIEYIGAKVRHLSNSDKLELVSNQ